MCHFFTLSQVSNWTLSPPAFNRSLRELSEAIGKPWLLYVPFFCPSNVYRDFRFVRGSSGPTEFAQPHPDDALEFYQMLFDEGLRNAMGGFEQDFLNFNFLGVLVRNPSHTLRLDFPYIYIYIYITFPSCKMVQNRSHTLP